MKVSAAGRAFLTKEEGVRTTAYKDSVGVWTIGVGHTTAAGAPVVTQGLKITAAEAQEILERDLTKFENYVKAAVRVPVSQEEFDALVSLCYNIGPGAFRGSSVARKLNAGDRAGAAEAFLMWKNAGGKPILLKRRQREKALFESGKYGLPSKTTKAVSKAVSASKAHPTTTIATGTAVATTAGTVVSQIGSWHAVAALAIILVAVGAAYLIWKKTK